jgi:hypothetical protein
MAESNAIFPNNVAEVVDGNFELNPMNFLYKNFREELVNSGQSFLDFRYQPRQYFNLPKHQYFETNKSYDCDGSFSGLTNLQKNNDLAIKTRTRLEYTCDINNAKIKVKEDCENDRRINDNPMNNKIDYLQESPKFLALSNENISDHEISKVTHRSKEVECAQDNYWEQDFVLDDFIIEVEGDKENAEDTEIFIR